MSTITKVMLVLIILAGGAGIFSGVSMTPSKIDALHEKTKAAAASVATKQTEIDKLQGESSTAKTNLENKIKEAESMINKVALAEQTAVAKTTEAAQNAKAVTDLAVKEQEYLALGQKYKADGVKLNGLPKLESDLAAYQGLTFDGQPVSDANKLRDYLKELEGLKKKTVTVVSVAPPVKVVRTTGKVTNVDDKFGYIQIMPAAEEGSVLNVKRGGNFVGQLKVVKSTATASYGLVNMPNTWRQILMGDTVEKSN